MALTSEGRALTELQRVGQVRKSAETLVKARVAYKRFLTTDDLDRSFAPWLAVTERVVEDGFNESAKMAAKYVPQFAAAEGAAIPDVPEVSFDRGKLTEDLWVNGPVNIKQKIGKGMDPAAAKSAAVERLLGVIQEHVLNGGRSVIAEASRYYGKDGRWRRVSDGKPCAFCAMLCGRGPVYSDETVKFRSHRSCGCGAEMVFGEWQPTKRESLWRASYDAAALEADEAGVKRLAPSLANEQFEDNILWRMRRLTPELFSDGVGESLLG